MAHQITLSEIQRDVRLISRISPESISFLMKKLSLEKRSGGNEVDQLCAFLRDQLTFGNWGNFHDESERGAYFDCLSFLVTNPAPD
jgi:hypothetical protein